MTIEQEFFEEFGIEPKYQDRCALEDRCKEQGLPWSEVEKRCPHKMNCTDNCVDAYNFAVYPHITPEIVLGLEEIILNCDYSLTKVPNHSYELDDLYCWFDTTNLGRYNCTGKNREEVTLKLLIELKDEIQDQVKALFNA